ncbi:MAG: family N-acetyltransferase [Deinococcus sp.]|nr:family N-acetyltransferase [Deinococcus sp.]
MTLPAGYILRPATPADAALIATQRAAMFADMNVEYSEAAAQFTPWVAARLAAGTYLGWIVEHDGVAVAGAGLMILDWPPHFIDPQPFRSYLLNVYTHPQHRGRGLAQRLTQMALEETQRRGIRIMSLHASEFGRPLYEKLGFKPTNEMRIVLEAEA